MSNPTDTTDNPAAGINAIAARAIGATIVAAEPIEVGTHGLVFRVPSGYEIKTVDVRSLEDRPRFIAGTFTFAEVASLVAYVNDFKEDGSTRAYMSDVTGRGAEAIQRSTTICTYVLDDLNPDNDPAVVGRRSHKALLELRPTTAARRWAAALQADHLTQAQMVELVIDGVTEIAEPPAADLRDVVRDLQAVRNTAAKSVVHTDGGFAIEVSEEVTLHAGKGATLSVPDKMRIVFVPWTALPAQQIVVDVKIRPEVRNGGTVVFRLEAPALEDALNDVLAVLHTALSAEPEHGTGIKPYRI